MATDQSLRQYDLVLYGATGYTGKLTAEYIVKHLPSEFKWAVSGRSSKKLSALVDKLRELDLNRVAPSRSQNLLVHDHKLIHFARY